MPSLLGNGQASIMGQHLYQTAPDGIHTDADENPHHRVLEQARQEGHPNQAQGRRHLRCNDALAVVNILELGAQQIRNQLNDVKDGRNQCQTGNRYIIFAVKSDEK